MKGTARMGVQREVLRRVQTILKGTRLCKDVLVVLPTEHLLRGFAFERTTEREMHYLWRIVMPLYRPATVLALNYSTRISSGGKIRLTRYGMDENARRVAGIMSPGHLGYVRRVRGPREFLNHVAWMGGNTLPNFKVDLALTHYVLGNVRRCMEILSSLPFEQLAPAWRGEVVSFCREVDARPGDAAARVRAWVRANVEELGLGETVPRC